MSVQHEVRDTIPPVVDPIGDGDVVPLRLQQAGIDAPESIDTIAGSQGGEVIPPLPRGVVIKDDIERRYFFIPNVDANNKTAIQQIANDLRARGQESRDENGQLLLAEARLERDARFIYERATEAGLLNADEGRTPSTVSALQLLRRDRADKNDSWLVASGVFIPTLEGTDADAQDDEQGFVTQRATSNTIYLLGGLEDDNRIKLVIDARLRPMSGAVRSHGVEEAAAIHSHVFRGGYLDRHMDEEGTLVFAGKMTPKQTRRNWPMALHEVAATDQPETVSNKTNESDDDSLDDDLLGPSEAARDEMSGSDGTERDAGFVDMSFSEPVNQLGEKTSKKLNRFLTDMKRLGNIAMESLALAAPAELAMVTSSMETETVSLSTENGTESTVVAAVEPETVPSTEDEDSAVESIDEPEEVSAEPVAPPTEKFGWLRKVIEKAGYPFGRRPEQPEPETVLLAPNAKPTATAKKREAISGVVLVDKAGRARMPDGSIMPAALADAIFEDLQSGKFTWEQLRLKHLAGMTEFGEVLPGLPDSSKKNGGRKKGAWRRRLLIPIDAVINMIIGYDLSDKEESADQPKNSSVVDDDLLQDFATTSDGGGESFEAATDRALGIVAEPASSELTAPIDELGAAAMANNQQLNRYNRLKAKFLAGGYNSIGQFFSHEQYGKKRRMGIAIGVVAVAGIADVMLRHTGASVAHHPISVAHVPQPHVPQAGGQHIELGNQVGTNLKDTLQHLGNVAHKAVQHGQDHGHAVAGNHPGAGLGTHVVVAHGGTIEGGVKEHLVQNGFDHSDQAVYKVTEHILHQRDMSWDQARLIHDGFGYDIPSNHEIGTILASN